MFREMMMSQNSRHLIESSESLFPVLGETPMHIYVLRFACVYVGVSDQHTMRNKIKGPVIKYREPGEDGGERGVLEFIFC